MIQGVEIDFVVKDSQEALSLYERIFDLNVIEATDAGRGQNEVIFSLYGVRFHMLDENEEFMLIAPKLDAQQTMWLNVAVPNIRETHDKAMNVGCKEIQAVTDMPEFGVSNSIFVDKFGYMWMLHQIHREVSFEERVELMQK